MGKKTGIWSEFPGSFDVYLFVFIVIYTYYCIAYKPVIDQTITTQSM